MREYLFYGITPGLRQRVRIWLPPSCTVAPGATVWVQRGGTRPETAHLRARKCARIPGRRRDRTASAAPSLLRQLFRVGSAHLRARKCAYMGGITIYRSID